MKLSAWILAVFFVASGCAVHAPSAGEPRREAKVRELLRLGTAALRQGDTEALERAEAFYELALELVPDDPRALDGLGSIAFRAGNLARAEWFFRRSERADPAYDRAYEHRALVAAIRGQSKSAAALSHAAIRINPLNYRARNNLAVLLGRSAEAERGAADRRARFELLKARGIFAKRDAGLPSAPAAIEDNLNSLSRPHEGD